jgi:hypothetical protein
VNLSLERDVERLQRGYMGAGFVPVKVQALPDVANVGIDGNANLVSQALNLDVTVVLAKSYSQQVGGNQHRRLHDHGAGQ